MSIREWHGREEEEDEVGEEGREGEAYIQARGRSPAGRRWESISGRASFLQRRQGSISGGAAVRARAGRGEEK